MSIDEPDFIASAADVDVVYVANVGELYPITSRVEVGFSTVSVDGDFEVLDTNKLASLNFVLYLPNWCSAHCKI